MLIATAIFGYLFVGVILACLFYHYQIRVFVIGPYDCCVEREDAFIAVMLYPALFLVAFIRVFIAWPIFWLLAKVGTAR